MNTLVAEYRKRVPNDPRSDDDLTLLLGQQNDADGRYNNFPDFVQDYQALKDSNKPPMAAEFRRGVSRGVESLKSTAYGAGALAADVVGAESVRNALAQKYQEVEKESAEDNAPGVARLEDIHGPGDVARYALGKAGELAPNVAEAAVIGAAGAVTGSAVGPEGTAAGGAAGLTEGFLARQAAKSLLKSELEKIIPEAATRAVVKGQLEKIAAREAVDALDPAAEQLLRTQARSIASKYGAAGANLLNFYGMGAGATYGQLANQPGVSDSNAQAAAMISGLGSSVGAALPSTVLAKLFPGVANDVADSYVKRVLTDAAKEVPVGAAGMAAMEAGNIAAERYAKGQDMGSPLTDEDLSRLLNSSIVGGMAGAVAAPVSAIRGPDRKAPTQTPQRFAPEVETHFTGVSDERRIQLEQLKARMENGTADEGDRAAVRTLPVEERNFYQLVRPRPEVSVPESSREEPAAPPASEGVPANQTAGAQTPVPASISSTPEASAQAKAEADRQALRAASTRATMDASNDPDVAEAQAKVRTAAAATDTNPTAAQKLAGNYTKGKVSIDGLQISIENPAGSERTGVGPDGKPWATKMPVDYGYILGTKGRDKDHVDVYIGPNPKVDRVYVVDQVDPGTGKFDEHKVMLGFDTQEAALAAYDSAFSDGSGPRRRGAVTPMSKDELKTWIKEGDTTKEISLGKPGAALPEEKLDFTDAGFKTHEESIEAWKKHGAHDVFETHDEFLKRVYCRGVDTVGLIGTAVERGGRRWRVTGLDADAEPLVEEMK